MTPADVHGSVPADDLVQGDERAVYADKAYDSEARRAGLRARGHRAADHAQGATQPAAGALAGGVQQGRRADPGRGRAAVRDHERAYGYRRVRHLGLARNEVQLQALCVAINLRRALALGLA